MTIVDPQIGTSANWSISNATVAVYGMYTDVTARSTGIPRIRSQGANVFTAAEGQSLILDMSADSSGGAHFAWVVRLVLAGDGTVLAEQQVTGTSTVAVHLEYVVTPETAGQPVVVEFSTTVAPGSTSYYLEYDNTSFTLSIADAPAPPAQPPVVASGVYRDRVTLSWSDGAGAHEQTFPAAVWPLGTDVTVDNGPGGVVTSRYRMVLKPVVPIPALGVTGLRIEWGEYTGDGRLYVDGAVERHKVGGRLHHYELTSKAVGG